jgi:hypothetical protein
MRFTCPLFYHVVQTMTSAGVIERMTSRRRPRNSAGHPEGGTVTPADRTPRSPADAPASFLAAAAALNAIDQAVRTAQTHRTATPDPGPEREPGPDDRTRTEQALETLLMLREVRDRLAGWEPALIEAAREAGASWADLAHPLGVASRQAAERRYLRVRPGPSDTTGEERVQATRDRRAADRSVTAWARGNAGELRQLTGQIAALAGLPAAARSPLVTALAADDAAGLVGPLAEAHPHLTEHHPQLAARVADVTRRTERLRRDSDDRRRASG